MASGDTIPGQVRIIREDTQGNRTIVLGDTPQAALDSFNNDYSPDERYYVNTGRTGRVNKPAGARSHDAPDMNFRNGEKLIVQHKSSNDSSRDINLDADSFSIEGVTVDMNRGNAYTKTLDQAEQELSGTEAESDTGFVDIYQYTVPDQRRFNVAGELEAVAVEN